MDGSKKTGCVTRLIQNHYSTKPLVKSEQQVSREKYLIPSVILFHRWFLMPAAVLIQFCCGSLYAWSVFNKRIDALLETSENQMAPVTFYIAIGSDLINNLV